MGGRRGVGGGVQGSYATLVADAALLLKASVRQAEVVT